MNLTETYAWIGYDDDKINGVYDGSVPRNDTTREAVRDRVDAMVSEATGFSALDIGCSGGMVSFLLARENGMDVHGIDCNQEAVDKANELAKQEPETSGFLWFRQGYAEDLGFKDNAFDTVLMGQVLEHVISPRIVLREAVRVLKTGGKLLASVPIGYNKTALHLRFFEQGTFYKLLSEFVKVNEIKIFNKQMLAICTKE